MSVQELRKGIHAEVEYDGANIGCIETDDGLVLVDTPMLRRDIEQWGQFVVGRSQKRVRYIVNTDHHFDHIIGNKRLGGTTVTHELARGEMLKEGMTLRESMAGLAPDRTREELDFILTEPLVPAEITFSGELSLHLGGRTLRLIHTPGHTVGTLCVYLVEDRMLFTGDNVVYRAHPYKGQAHFGAWLETFRTLVGLPAEVVVPGHGEVCDGAGLRESIQYFEKLVETTRALLIERAPRDDVVRQVHDRLFDYYEVEPEMREGATAVFDEGTGRLYDELKASMQERV